MEMKIFLLVMLKISKLLEYMIPEVSFSRGWFHILLRSKSQEEQRDLEMDPRGFAGHGPSC